MIKFAKKCTSDSYNTHMFPLNINNRKKETFQVNFARTTQYFKSTIPQCQRLLNITNNNTRLQLYINISFYLKITVIFILNLVFVQVQCE